MGAVFKENKFVLWITLEHQSPQSDFHWSLLLSPPLSEETPTAQGAPPQSHLFQGRNCYPPSKSYDKSAILVVSVPAPDDLAPQYMHSPRNAFDMPNLVGRIMVAKLPRSGHRQSFDDWVQLIHGVISQTNANGSPDPNTTRFSIAQTIVPPSISGETGGDSQNYSVGWTCDVLRRLRELGRSSTHPYMMSIPELAIRGDGEAGPELSLTNGAAWTRVLMFAERQKLAVLSSDAGKLEGTNIPHIDERTGRNDPPDAFRLVGVW